jgi:hypothetical protein
MARRPGTAKGGQTARERYYNAQAKKVEMENKRRAGDLVEAAAMEARYGQLVTAFATELQNLAGTAVQQGLVTRDREAALQSLIDNALKKLSERRPGA